jgi:hypothetical protein
VPRRPARDDEFRAAYEKFGGNISKAAHSLGLTRATGQHYVRKLGLRDGKPIAGGQLHVEALREIPLPKKGEIRTHLLTCAQSCTFLADRVWETLETARDYYAQRGPASIEVSRFTYNQNGYGPLAVKPETKKAYERSLWFDERIEDHVSDENVAIAPGLVWCGKMNILPTAVDPLSDLENHTRRRSGIFPHVKVAQRSVPTLAGSPAKLNYTTGTVTQHNYIQKKAGQKAEFHHTYGALLVEVDHLGNWFCRQLISDEHGRIYDLDVAFEAGEVHENQRALAITWGDWHSRHLDPGVERMGWLGMYEPEIDRYDTSDTMLSVLRPHEQHIHDLEDQYARNPHDEKDCHRMYRRHVEGFDSVEEEIALGAQKLHDAHRDETRAIVVNSNHDEMITRWLRDTDGRRDPLNARFWFQANDAVYAAIEEGREDDFVILEWASRRAGCPESVRFLREDESHVLCGDIECGMHGDLGPNGARGTPKGLSKLGRRANTGHTHSAEIRDGMYVAGTSSKLKLIYTKGPSSWSHSHIVTYSNGKRAIVTMYGGKWRA